VTVDSRGVAGGRPPWLGQHPERARDSAPSLVFLDEVDAFAPRRGQSFDSGVTDRVVAALLTELDGIDPLRDVVVLGATNRPDMLDPALLRGGRLSRQVEIPLPDEEARLAILLLHTREAKMDPRVDLGQLAADTDDFSGADLRALVNEAGLQALIRLSEDPDGFALLTPDDFALALENLQPGDAD